MDNLSNTTRLKRMGILDIIAAIFLISLQRHTNREVIAQVDAEVAADGGDEE